MINKPNIIGIIQARMDSKRLPGKSLKILRGKPMLEHILNNVNGSELVDKFVVATSKSKSNKSICDLCDSMNIDYYEGNELDVLSRFVDISKFYNADILVRLTGDNPFVEHSFIDCMVQKYLNIYNNYDYLHNFAGCNFPFGLFVEIFTKDALMKASLTKSKEDKEHVTLFFKKNSKNFKIAAVKAENIYKYERLTVDTEVDFNMAEKIMKELNYPKNSFTYLDLTK
jgi:spore coat polysaccharide biosynthesis protein SpsF